MNRMYELAIVTEPRQTEDDVQAICDRMKELIENSGSQVFHVDDWGKRKLAYPIRKFNEGRYNFLYVAARDGAVPDWSTIERLLQQDRADSPPSGGTHRRGPQPCIPQRQDLPGSSGYDRRRVARFPGCTGS